MGFFQQAWIGLKKELSVYKNEPKLLLSKAASVIIFVAITIATGIFMFSNRNLLIGATSGDSVESAAITNAICQLELYFTPARAVLFKVSTERADNFKEYLMVSPFYYNSK